MNWNSFEEKVLAKVNDLLSRDDYTASEIKAFYAGYVEGVIFSGANLSMITDTDLKIRLKKFGEKISSAVDKMPKEREFKILSERLEQAIHKG
jgi:hypothetical protein